MLVSGLLRALSRSPATIRLIATVWVLGLLALASNGGLTATPLAAESRPTQDSPVEPVAAQSGPPVQARAPTAEPGKTAQPNPDRSVATAADMQARPPEPNPALPPWATSTRETGLWSGPSEGNLFSLIPSDSTLRVLEKQGTRFRVFYSGDRASARPGEAWVEAADLAPAAWPRWARLRSAGSVLNKPSADAATVRSLKRGAFVEVIGDARGQWAPVYYLGDGREAQTEGWLEVGPTAAMPGQGAGVISSFALTREALAANRPEPWLKIPYRSQLDGTSYALANCGPSVVGMVLESFGLNLPQPLLRREVLSLQPSEDCDDCGVYLQNMAEVISQKGLKVIGLREAGPESFHTWTLDEVRAELRAGHPVVAQVFYRGLPGRGASGYWGDHYVVLSGMLGDRFLFNDPVDVDGPGYSRLITAQALQQAMRQSDYPNAAFSVSR